MLHTALPPELWSCEGADQRPVQFLYPAVFGSPLAKCRACPCVFCALLSLRSNSLTLMIMNINYALFCPLEKIQSWETSSSILFPTVLSLEVEILVRAHECHTLACNMEGIATVLRYGRVLTSTLAETRDYILMVIKKVTLFFKTWLCDYWFINFRTSGMRDGGLS